MLAFFVEISNKALYTNGLRCVENSVESVDYFLYMHFVCNFYVKLWLFL
jgi:hypothetical protein